MNEISNNNENVVTLFTGEKPNVTTTTTSRAARRNGLYLSNKELNEFNLDKNKFGAQLSLNDIVTKVNPIDNNTGSNAFIIHEDKNNVRRVNDDQILMEEEDDEFELKSMTSNNSASTINKRSSIPYVNNRFSTASSMNGSSVRNSKRFSTISGFSSDSDDDMKLEGDEDFNRCFFNNPHGRTRNLTTISIHSKSSNESIGFQESKGGKPGLVGYESEPHQKKTVKVQKQPPQNNQHNLQLLQHSQQQQQQQQQQQHHQPSYTKRNNPHRQSQISSTSDRRQSQISTSSDKRHSQISSASSDRSSRRLSVMSLLRHQDQGHKHLSQARPADVAPYVATKRSQHHLLQQYNHQQQQQQQQLTENQLSSHKPQLISQPSSSRIHRLMHSVSIRSGLFKLKEPPANIPPEEKKVQMKRSFFSIRSGLNRSPSTMDIGGNGSGNNSSNIDRRSISLPVPQDQTVQKIDNRLKNSSSRFSLAASEM